MISARRVLVLTAHPDDEMACSGTITRLVESGASVEVLTFSDCSDMIPAGFTAADLIGEWHEAWAALGVGGEHLTLLDVPNRFFPVHRQRILDKLIEIRDGPAPPDLVLLPASSDVHQDHATVAAEGTRAFKHATVLGYEHAFNTVTRASWPLFVRLEPGHVEVKLRHAATYRTQAHRTYMAPDYIRSVVTVHGVQANVPAAEAFEIVRWIA